ncbi:hypothetical protein AVT69_gp181 [Pseudomonas phage PhiPA3]|uniref:Uncharacterized protein 183 n=1 Tax=Pseudomonas phage PhiPA3 TaxID=998086 RepID=F8SK53_BPPA3|nr:hypothetical protein AVT69_gp181 [Pseudomonas phage PhiPA3]AEH03606.1 hypothetical protein [Pseudomonas phage PhiPA3]
MEFCQFYPAVKKITINETTMKYTAVSGDCVSHLFFTHASFDPDNVSGERFDVDIPASILDLSQGDYNFTVINKTNYRLWVKLYQPQWTLDYYPTTLVSIRPATSVEFKMVRNPHNEKSYWLVLGEASREYDDE